MPSSFTWDVSPEIFVTGMEDYEITTFHVLFDLCVVYAERMQTVMRQNASAWEDKCFPNHEYLRAEAFYPDTNSVGIRAWYDLDLYRSQCSEPAYDWVTVHESQTYAQAGVMSIILPRGESQGVMTVLGQLADELMDAVRALYAH